MHRIVTLTQRQAAVAALVPVLADYAPADIARFRQTFDP